MKASGLSDNPSPRIEVARRTAPRQAAASAEPEWIPIGGFAISYAAYQGAKRIAALTLSPARSCLKRLGKQLSPARKLP
jgi:hypothetical protein